MLSVLDMNYTNGLLNIMYPLYSSVRREGVQKDQTANTISGETNYKIPTVLVRSYNSL